MIHIVLLADFVSFKKKKTKHLKIVIIQQQNDNCWLCVIVENMRHNVIRKMDIIYAYFIRIIFG